MVPGEGWRTAEGPGTTGDGSSVCCVAARRDSTLVTRQASPSEEWSFRVCDHSTHAPPYTHVPTYTHPHKAPMNPHAHTRTQTDANPDAHGHVNQDVADRIETEGRGRQDRQKRHETGSLGRFSGRASQSRSAFRVPGVTQKWTWDSGVLSLDTELQVSMKGSLKGPWGSGSEMPTKHGLVLPPACVQMDSRVCASSRAHARA